MSHKTTKLEFVFALKKKKITVNEQRCSFKLGCCDCKQIQGNQSPEYTQMNELQKIRGDQDKPALCCC